MKSYLVWGLIAGLSLSLINQSFGITDAEIREQIGLTQLQDELGASAPDGAGITFSQVEALDGGYYLPNVAGKSINNVTGYRSGISSHATTVGNRAYDNVASGSTEIDSYNLSVESGDSGQSWLSNYLNYGTSDPVVAETQDVQVHAWVADAGAGNTEVLARHDFQIQSSDFVAVVGLNNPGKGSRPLLSNGYNSISVGLTNRNNVSTPDIVAPDSFTSYATGTVAGVSALLLDAGQSYGANATTSATVKAVMFSGATKSELNSWSNTSTQPLDTTYGVGEVNVNNSYRIMTAGEQEASITSDVSATGWDHDSVSSGADASYFFEVTEGTTIESLSITLTWNATVTESNVGPFYSYSYDDLANMDLSLYDVTEDYTLGSLVASSEATEGNIEHIWLENLLSGGRYAIVVDSDDANFWDYSLAWDVVPVPEPATALLLALAMPMLLGRDRRRG